MGNTRILQRQVKLYPCIEVHSINILNMCWGSRRKALSWIGGLCVDPRFCDRCQCTALITEAVLLQNKGMNEGSVLWNLLLYGKFLKCSQNNVLTVLSDFSAGKRVNSMLNKEEVCPSTLLTLLENSAYLHLLQLKNMN